MRSAGVACAGARRHRGSLYVADLGRAARRGTLLHDWGHVYSRPIVWGTVGISGWRRAVLAAGAMAVLGLPVGQARAADPAEVEALIQQGNALRKEAKNHQAFPLLRKAYDLSPTPRTAAQLGLVEMELSYWLEAERHLSEALAAPRDLWVHRNRPTLEATLRQVTASIGVLRIAGSPPGAEVSVNGRSVGRFPLEGPIRVAEGPVQVEVSAPGFVAQTRSVSVAGESQEHVVVELHRAGAEWAVGSRSDLSVTAGAPNETGAGRRRLGAWLSAGGSAAALGLAVFANVRWQDRRAAFDDHHIVTSTGSTLTRRYPCGEDEIDRGGSECQRIYSQLRRARTLAVVGYAAAGLLAATSVIFFSSGAEGRPPEAFLACGGLGLSMGASCRIGF
jgi:hypothetical protein